MPVSVIEDTAVMRDGCRSFWRFRHALPTMAASSALGAFLVASRLAAQAPGSAPSVLSPSTDTAAQPRAGLAFTGVTVVDVTDGRLIPDQVVVVAGNRVEAVGPTSTVRPPAGVPVVDARGKYLIPGLWDMHVHLTRYSDTEIFYPLLIANGVTGIREAGTLIPLDSVHLLRREIAAGGRLGPRQISAGPSLKGRRKAPATIEEAERVTDSLKAAGADFIKMRALPRTIFSAIAARARRLGIPFGGHLPSLSPAEASDSGVSIIDHTYGMDACIGPPASVEQCVSIAERLRRNGTWVVPTLVYMEAGHKLTVDSSPGTPLSMGVARSSGLPVLAGTDAAGIIWPGPSLHKEMGLLVKGGLTPLAALQAATLNPAQALHATDSLGTVAPGKLADLVLLDANPLADITNTKAIHAVVANGRYFGRPVLDSLLAAFQAKDMPGR
jgi:imidazolonepropionase-like amidohydrolase